MAFINLAVPFFSVTEPQICDGTEVTLPPSAKYVPKGIAPAPADDGSRKWRWTMWEQVEVQGPLTLAEMLQWLEDQFGSPPEMVNFGTAMLFASFQAMMMPKDKLSRRQGLTMAELAEEITKKPVPFHDDEGAPPATIELIVGLEDEDLQLPPIKYVLSKSEVDKAKSRRSELGVVVLDAASSGGAAGAGQEAMHS